MKHFIYYPIITLLILSCSKQDITTYDRDNDSLQFVAGNLSYSYNFALQNDGKGNQNQPWMEAPYYYGDSLRTDTIKLRITLMGHATNIDRQFYLDTTSVEHFNGLEKAEIEFFNPYTFRAGNTVDTISIVLHRPATRGNFGIGITFDKEKNISFEQGAKELQTYELEISDKYSKPETWDMCSFLGDYSDEKYAFILSVTHMSFDIPYVYYGLMNDPYTLVHDLTDALNHYNTEHPESPKNFTFPTL